MMKCEVQTMSKLVTIAKREETRNCKKVYSSTLSSFTSIKRSQLRIPTFLIDCFKSNIQLGIKIRLAG